MSPALLRRIYVLLSATLLAQEAVRAQTLLGGEFRINETARLNQGDQQLAVGPDGSFTVGWTHLEGEVFGEFIAHAATRFYDAMGMPLGGERLSENNPGEQRGKPFIFNRPGGGFRALSVSVTIRDGLATFLLENYSAFGEALGEVILIDPADPIMAITNVAATPKGRLILSWLTSHNSPQDEIKALKLGPRGQALWDEVVVSADENPQFFGDVGADSQGNAVVTWAGECGPYGEGRCDAFAQRLSPAGEKLGGPIRANTSTAGLQEAVHVAVAPGGNFLVVWNSVPGFPGPSTVDVYAQRFASSGHRLGREFRVNATTGIPQFYPAAAVDPFGNYLVVWLSQKEEDGQFRIDIRGRLFRPDGRPVGREFLVNTQGLVSTETPQPRIAFGNGTFVAVWNTSDGDFDGVFGQRFVASPADEPCITSDEVLLCDTGRSGGQAELRLAYPSGELILGDLDNDDRKDPCRFSDGAFECDTDHRGEPFEVSLRFGRAGDVPLFGDVDGDGRDEPCVRRGRFFLCDTGHDGGRAEASFGLGTVADQPLLGDVNGDGRDDPCVFEPAGRFVCSLRHRGSQSDFILAFGQSGDLPVLGDFDGDGDDDPCVYRAGTFLCDTAHDGGAAEARLAFGLPGHRPLLGNLDGL